MDRIAFNKSQPYFGINETMCCLNAHLERRTFKKFTADNPFDLIGFFYLECELICGRHAKLVCLSGCGFDLGSYALCAGLSSALYIKLKILPPDINLDSLPRRGITCHDIIYF